MFKEKFKYYKRKIPEPNLDQVCDTDTGDPRWLSEVSIFVFTYHNSGRSIKYHFLFEQFRIKFDRVNSDEVTVFGFKRLSQWKVYQLNSHPGT